MKEYLDKLDSIFEDVEVLEEKHGRPKGKKSWKVGHPNFHPTKNKTKGYGRYHKTDATKEIAKPFADALSRFQKAKKKRTENFAKKIKTLTDERAKWHANDNADDKERKAERLREIDSELGELRRERDENKPDTKKFKTDLSDEYNEKMKNR